MRRLLIFVAGCWSSQPPPPALPQNAVAMPSRREARASHHTEWLGRYVCAQGPTGVHLVIDAPEHAAATAVFEFFPLDENPGPPAGSFKLTGIVTADAMGALTIDLGPDRWINQPTGYMMVGLSATTDAARQTLTGTIANSSCGEITATRSE